MAENVRVRTTCLLKSISEDCEPAVIQRAGREESLLVGGLSEADY